ncbi:hypothetical protein EDB89DRAFT_1956319 [Lactarius sanguifluus]|nr:hypothetical protein EDB89DRAFT_2027134 [Lactarius sanguifluus]KAH9173801.1 hypothetical protein EDB89DRAFT_1956319 [Lactarius sanguifluus]
MFGESESESPRVPSPWDRVLSSSVRLDRVHYHQEELLLPKLAAEVEEGNVEYKLHLISPSPARFVHLVTQMKWRLLEGGGQAIYELGVADSGALVGLSPSDLRATLKTLRAMAAEIGARVIIAKEIEVAISEHTFVAAGFRSPAHKQNGSKDKAVKDLSRFLAESDSSPRSFASATSMTTSSVDSSSPSTTDLQVPPSSPPPSPLPPISSIETSLGDHETAHDDDSLFPMLTLDEPHHLAHGLASGEELLIGRSQSGTVTVPKSPMTRIQDDVLQERDEPLLTAFGKLEVADSSWVPEEGKRMIVEAMIIRELDQEEGFLDFSSF